MNILLTYFAFLQESPAPIPAKKTGTESSRIEQPPHVCAYRKTLVLILLSYLFLTGLTCLSCYNDSGIC